MTFNRKIAQYTASFQILFEMHKNVFDFKVNPVLSFQSYLISTILLIISIGHARSP